MKNNEHKKCPQRDTIIIIILYYAKWQQITDATNTNTIKHTTGYETLHTQLGREKAKTNNA